MDNHFNLLFKMSHDGLLILDADGDITDWNGPTLELFGLVPEEIEECSLDQLLEEPIFEEIKRALSRKHELKGQRNARRPVGDAFPIAIKARELGESPTRYLLVLNDLSKAEGLTKVLAATRDRLKKMVHRVGLGQVATGVLHNIGNVLNSINITVQNLSEVSRDSKIPELLKANQLFQQNLHHIGEYVTQDPAGRFLPEFYNSVGELLEKDNLKLKEELLELQLNINLVKDLIATQQDYARQGPSRKTLKLANLIQDALKIEQLSLQKHQIKVNLKLDGEPYIYADKAKVLHIFLNVIKNAKEAILAGGRPERTLDIDISSPENDRVHVRVVDNGIGIAANEIKSVFQYGFTTRQDGHGFGLFTSYQAMEELGGAIEAASEGPGRGACFELTFPVHTPPTRPD